jgi:DNA transformation protein and related proteins
MNMDKPILKNSMQLFEQLGPIRSRSMFGGFGLFIDDTMFALVVHNSLHIRADEQTAVDFKQLGYQPYIYKKRGFPVTTKYFALPDQCWENIDSVMRLATAALASAKNEKDKLATSKPERLKDLPNLRLATERMLKKAGINNVDDLHLQGSVNAFKAIQESHPATQLSLELLWSLEGAIEGMHWSVLPKGRREELAKKIS